jgi:hypothetical protein
MSFTARRDLATCLGRSTRRALPRAPSGGFDRGHVPFDETQERWVW